jgi:RNA polymerase sigma-70 factor (ECF subfamily)
MVLSDNEIIERVQDGERELFGELHSRHHERVYRYVARSIFEREAAQDVACEVWLRAYNAVDKFRPQGAHSVLAWLLRIASNLVTDYRRRLPPQGTDDSEIETTLRLVSPAAEREVLRSEQSRAVRQAIARLSLGDQQIIHLAHDNDLSSADIAIILDKPSVSAVTSHLHRAMRHLKQALENSGWFNEYATEVKVRSARG